MAKLSFYIFTSSRDRSRIAVNENGAFFVRFACFATLVARDFSDSCRFLTAYSSAMTSQGWMLPLLVVIVRATVLISAARLPNQESLKGALDAVNAWKQRSLDAADVAPEYYNDLYSTFKYRDNDAGRKFDRNFGENDEDIEFLPGGGCDQKLSHFFHAC